MYRTTTIYIGRKATPNTLFLSIFSTTHVTETTTITETVRATANAAMTDAPAATGTANTLATSLPLQSNTAAIAHRMVGNLTGPLWAAATNTPTIPTSYEEYVPVLKWVLAGAFLGAGVYKVAAQLYRHYHASNHPKKSPIPLGESAQSWKSKAKLTNFLLQKCAQNNKELRKDLQKARDDLQEAQEQENTLQKGLLKENLYREKLQLNNIPAREKHRLVARAVERAFKNDTPEKIAASIGYTPRSSLTLNSSLPATPTPRAGYIRAAGMGSSHQPQSIPPLLESRTLHSQAFDDAVVSNLEKLSSRIMSTKEFQSGVERRIELFEGPPGLKAKKRKAEEDIHGKQDIVANTNHGVVRSSSSKKARGKQKGVAFEDEDIEISPFTRSTARDHSDIEVYDGMIDFTTSPDINMMDLKFRKKNVVKKLDFKNVPALKAFSQESELDRPKKRARKESSANGISNIPISSPGKRRSQTPRKASYVSSTSPTRRSARLSSHVAGSLNEKELSRQTGSPSKTLLDSQNE